MGAGIPGHQLFWGGTGAGRGTASHHLAGGSACQSSLDAPASI